MAKTNESPIRRTMSRRSALKSFGAASAAPLLLKPNPGGAAAAAAQRADAGPARRVPAGPPSLHRLAAGDLVAEFDKDTGTLHSIASRSDGFGTNFLGNRTNVQGAALRDAHWTGDVVAAVWDLEAPDWSPEQSPDPGTVYPRSGRWRREMTLESDDNRRVSFDADSFRVEYATPSANPHGLRSLRLAMAYAFGPGGALTWDIEIENATDRLLEIGELALPLRANDDYAGPYEGTPPRVATVQGKMPAIQKIIHEQKVLAHFFVAGNGSYALVQRPDGTGPFLLVRAEGDTAFECLYKAEGFGGNWIGTDLLAIHSWAVYQQRGWDWNPWVNGHTSLVLKPGEKRAFKLTFVLIGGYDEIRRRLVESGHLGIRALPGMVVPEGTDVRVEIESRAALDDVEIKSDGVTVKDRRRTGSSTLLALSFEGRGQKSLRLRYGGGRQTWLHFYCVENPGLLLKARAHFMATRQYYENPQDPYNRNHLFLPFDDRLRTCEKWFTTGPFKHVGLITGSNAVDIAADLEREGWTRERGRLLELMEACNAEFIRDPYPYSSEIQIDETGQHQVYFFTRFFAGRGSAESRAKQAKVVGVLKALRGGDQPVWFNYGNDLFAHPDLRGQLSCWHSEVLNGLALLAHYEDSGDPQALMKGYPGVLSVLRCARADGMGFAWFMYAPGIFGFEPPRTFEGGLALWGFLRAAKAYVVEDSAFGLTGYGCRVERTAGGIRAIPWAGVDKRLRFAAAAADVEAEAGEIAEATLEPGGGLELCVADSTGLIRTARLVIRRLRPGTYRIEAAGRTDERTVEDVLRIEMPMAEAAKIRIYGTAAGA